MKTKHFFVALLALSIFGFGACQPNDEDSEEPTLQVSNAVLDLDNSGNAATVTVTTNQPKWIATSPKEGEWLVLEQQGNNLTVKAEKNDSYNPRQTSIIVQAGPLLEKISVKQSGSDIVLNVSPEEVNFRSSGGNYRVDIRSNAGNWSLEKENDDVSWLTIRSFKNFAEIVVEPSSEKGVRTTKLFAKSGTANREITVTQAGIGETRFVLPLFNPNPTKFELVDYERKQNNIFLQYTPPSSGFFGNSDGYFAFLYSSPIFDEETYYNISLATNSIDKIFLYSSNGADELLSQAYQDFLTEKGFKDILVDKIGRTLSANATTDLVNVKLNITTKNKAAEVVFAISNKQDQAYPTFKEFPYDNSGFLDNPEWTYEKIKLYEEQNGSEIVEDKSDAKMSMLVATLSQKFHPTFIRVYHVSTETNTTSQLMTVWNDFHLGAWELPNGSFNLTEEFMDLMTKSGFKEYSTTTSGILVYSNDAGMLIAPRGTRFTDVLNGSPVFAINYWYANKTDGDSENGKKAMMEKISKDLSEINGKFGRIGSKR